MEKFWKLSFFNMKKFEFPKLASCPKNICIWHNLSIIEQFSAHQTLASVLGFVKKAKKAVLEPKKTYPSPVFKILAIEPKLTWPLIHLDRQFQICYQTQKHSSQGVGLFWSFSHDCTLKVQTFETTLIVLNLKITFVPKWEMRS